MNESMVMIYYFIGGIMVLVMVMGLWVALVIPGIDRWSRRFFIGFFSILVLCMGMVFIDLLCYGKPNLRVGERLATYFEYLLISILMPLLLVYLLHSCGEDWQHSALFRVSFALWGLFFILLQINQFTGWFYDFTPNNVFYRTPWHPVLLGPVVLILILTFAGVIHRRKRLSRRYLCAFLIYLLPITVAMFIHMFVYVPLFIDIGIVISALSLFSIVLSDEVKQYARQQQEIAHQRASIMVLQMRPHFIYNTMMSIYYLCEQDPRLAQRVTLDFTRYLRKNFTAIASEDMIPFSDELEHTRAYLAVEQAQFEDMLFVDYDTPHTQFRVPPLTLQPIVENAVVHGMDPDAEPLRISIRTRSTDSGSEILVEDNGPGYAPADDHEPHIALANIRERLEMMCRGRLEITHREDGGTAVRILVP